MSKKLKYLQIIIGLVCILVIGLVIYMILCIKSTIDLKENFISETILESEKEKIVFDLTIPPKDQRKKIYDNKNEYLKQLYKSIFKDDKFVNCTPILSYGSLVDDFKSVRSLVEFLKPLPYWNLPDILFEFNNPKIIKRYFLAYPLNLDDIPVTEKYKENHPKPLFEEFNFIKKENYETKKKYDTNLQTETWLYLTYKYGIGVDEEEKTINVVETKSVTFLYEDDNGEERTRVVFDGKGHEMTEDSIDTREFVFKYTLDEKGYVDDVEFVKEKKLADDKYLDQLWKNVKG